MCPVTMSALGIGSAAAAGAGGAAAATVGAGAVAGSAVAATGAAALTTSQIVTLGITLAGGAFGAISSVQAGRAANQAAKAQAKQEEEAARDAIVRGNEEGERRRQAGRKIQAEQAARMAANGVDVNAGSALDVLDETLITTEEDAFNIRTNAAREARGNFAAAADLRSRGATAQKGGIFKGVGTVLTTGSKLSSQWRAFTAPPQFTSIQVRQ